MAVSFAYLCSLWMRFLLTPCTHCTIHSFIRDRLQKVAEGVRKGVGTAVSLQILIYYPWPRLFLAGRSDKLTNLRILPRRAQRTRRFSLVQAPRSLRSLRLDKFCQSIRLGGT